MNSSPEQRVGWMRFFPPSGWLAAYRGEWLLSDAVAGVTLAAYAIPVSLAYAALAGLPPQVGIYGYMLGGIGYALLGSSRQLAVGPTSAISLMIASTVGALAGGDAVRYAQIASLAACAVAMLCFIAWLFKLSVLVRLVSDSILVGFKAGAGLTIIMSQLPSLFGVAGGGHNFFDRAIRLAGQLGDVNLLDPGDRRGRASAAAVRRTVAAGKAGRNHDRGVLDRGRNAPWPSVPGRAGHRKNPGRIAGLGIADLRSAGVRRSLSARRRLRAAGLHRRRLRGPQLCRQAWLYPRRPAGVSGAGRREPRGGLRPRLSRRGWPVAIRRQRQRGRAHATGAGDLLGDACAVSAVLHGIVDQSCPRRCWPPSSLPPFTGWSMSAR